MGVVQRKFGASEQIYGIVGQPEADPSQTLVVLFAGYSQAMSEKNYYHSNLRKYLVQEQGVTVVQFDYRGHGDSQGELGDACIETMCEDATVVMETLRKEADVTRLIFIGHGFGCWVASRVANRLNQREGALDLSIVMVSPQLSRLPQTTDVFSADTLALMAQEGRLDSQLLCPGYDYYTFEDFDMKKVDYFTKLGCYMLYLHGQCISNRFLQQMDRFDPLTELEANELPVQLFIGEQDEQQAAAADMPNVQLTSIPSVRYFYEHPQAMDFLLEQIGARVAQRGVQHA